MVHPHWIGFGTFMAGVLAVALYGLTASGHFPAEARSAKFKGGWGALVLWGTLTTTVLAAASMLLKSWSILPWYLQVIGGGAMLLFAPAPAPAPARQLRQRPPRAPRLQRGRSAPRRPDVAQSLSVVPTSRMKD